MYIKTPGIVIHSLKYGDSSLIVQLYTLQQGYASFIVRLPKSTKRGGMVALYEPLYLLDIEADFRPTREISPIRSAKIFYPYRSIPFNSYKLSIVFFLSEVLYRVLKYEQQNEALFSYIMYSLRWLDGRNDNFSNFHIVFFMHLTCFLGFYPNMESWQNGSFFDLQNSSFVKQPPFHSSYLVPDEAEKLPMLMRLSYETMHLCALSREQRNRCIEVLNNYYRLHVPGFPELKSLDVLSSLFV